MKVVVTGGAGFIGSHTLDLLIESGHEVLVYDNLEAQVHPNRTPPPYLNSNAKLIRGDVRDRKQLASIVRMADAVVHLAATVGVGQSMYQPDRYVSTNTQGTATLLDILVNEEHSVRKLVVASSMSVYGEGKYVCDECGPFFPSLRSESQLMDGNWEHNCDRCGNRGKPAPTDETKPPYPTSLYSQTKRHQEEMCILLGKTFGIPTVALRYFSVYGPRQALGNPYTGVASIFISRIRNGKPPFIFEDGQQLRDFVHVRDVAKANLLALDRNSCNYQIINIGTGIPTSIVHLANLLTEAMQANASPLMSQRYRQGDVRHCYADISLARKLLDFEPSVSIEEGLKDLIEWASRQPPQTDTFEKALKELEQFGLA